MAREIAIPAVVAGDLAKIAQRNAFRMKDEGKQEIADELFEAMDELMQAYWNASHEGRFVSVSYQSAYSPAVTNEQKDMDTLRSVHHCLQNAGAFGKY